MISFDHISYRRIAWEMYEAVRKQYPSPVQYFRTTDVREDKSKRVILSNWGSRVRAFSRAGVEREGSAVPVAGSTPKFVKPPST